MALTAGQDLYASVGEEGINRFVRHLFRQRPSLFTFATPGIAAYADEFLDPAVPLSGAQVARGQPRVSELSRIPVLGTDGPVELEYCVQLTAFEFDFHPGDEFDLPVGRELEAQQFGVHAAFAVGLGCPKDAAPDFRRRIRDRSIFEGNVLSVLQSRGGETPPGQRSVDHGEAMGGLTGGRPLADGGRASGSTSVAQFGFLPAGPGRDRFVGGDQRVLAPPDVELIRKPDVTMHRFELHAFLVGGVDIGTDGDENGNRDAFAFELDHLELGGGDDGSAIDLPTGLKNSIECYVDLYVRHVVLPSVSEMIQSTVASALDNDLLKTELTPEDPTARFPETDAIPDNPNLADDRLEVYVDLDITGDGQ
jgi:hypothetical protein